MSFLSEQTLWQLIITPFSYPFDPSKRLFWLFILSALLLASITVAWQQRELNLAKQIRSLFNPRYWLHRSTLIDTGLLFVNSSLKILLLIPLLGSHLAMTMLVAKLLQSHLGDAPAIQASWLFIGLAYTLSFFILEDLSRFGLHYAMHKVPWLWRLHSVHHSATILTPLTLFRVHPIESILYYLRGLVVFGVVSGTFIYLFKSQVHGFDIIGVDALGFFFNLLGANLRHSSIWLSFGQLERLFISPAQHQIHHSNAIAHRDKNFGTCLAIWDHLMGSWITTHKQARPKLSFGLTKASGNI